MNPSDRRRKCALCDTEVNDEDIKCAECQEVSKKEEYDSGYDSGHDDGYREGLDKGKEEGKQEEHDEAYDEGYQEGLAEAERRIHEVARRLSHAR